MRWYRLPLKHLIHSRHPLISVSPSLARNLFPFIFELFSFFFVFIFIYPHFASSTLFYFFYFFYYSLFQFQMGSFLSKYHSFSIGFIFFINATFPRQSQKKQPFYISLRCQLPITPPISHLRHLPQFSGIKHTLPSLPCQPTNAILTFFFSISFYNSQFHP